MLTRKQHELLIFIHKHLKKHGVSPSFEEMKEAVGLKSKSGIHRLVTGLEERGFLRRLPHRARALEVLRLPDNVSQRGKRAKGFAPRVIEGDRKAAASEMRRGRLLGRSIRTDEFRYVEWRDQAGRLAARELYDHRQDGAQDVLEKRNVVDDPQFSRAVQQLQRQLHDRVPHAPAARR